MACCSPRLPEPSPRESAPSTSGWRANIPGPAIKHGNASPLSTLVTKARTAFGADPALSRLCGALVLPRGATLTVDSVRRSWKSAWSDDSTLPPGDTVLAYAQNADTQQDSLWRMLDQLAALRRSEGSQPLTLAVYFAPGRWEVDMERQHANVKRLAEAVRLKLESTAGPVVIEGRADYTSNLAGSAADAANEQLAQARARALKLAILQMDNRIDEGRLVTTAHVLSKENAATESERLGAAETEANAQGAKPEISELERRRVENGIRVGNRASGVYLKPSQLVAQGPHSTDDGALASRRTSFSAPGVTPTQWAVALTNVVVDRASQSAQSLAFSRAARQLCDSVTRSQFRATCGLVYNSTNSPRDWPTLDNLRSAFRSDLAIVLPSMVDRMLSVPTVPESEEYQRSAMKSLERWHTDHLGSARTAKDTIRIQTKFRADSGIIVAEHAELVSLLQANTDLASELRDLRLVLRAAESIARRIDAGDAPLEAVAALRSPLDTTAADGTPLARTLRQVAEVVSEFRDAERTLLAARLQDVAISDTLLLYAARTFMVNSQDRRQTKPENATMGHAVTESPGAIAFDIERLLERSATLVSAASALDSVFRMGGATSEAAGTREARFAAAANRYAAYVRLVRFATYGTEAGRGAALLDSMLVPARDIAAAVAAGHHRVAFAQLGRLATLTGGERFGLDDGQRRVLAFAVDVAEASSVDDAEDAIERFLDQGRGFRQKQYGDRRGVRPKVLLLNAYAGGVAQVGVGRADRQWGWFLPVGVEAGWRLRGVRYLGILVYPIDLGAFTALRVSGEEADDTTELVQALSPGLAVVTAPIPDVPITFGATVQWRTVAGESGRRGRVSLFTGFDVPLFP